ncbi:MAG: hypothetical protein RDV41_02345 [Planctomycetota bacterium]|nr:hypothetical protein [Planctomycetota bacterium]
MSDSELEQLEQGLTRAASRLGGTVLKDGDAFLLRAGYRLALNPNDARVAFRIAPRHAGAPAEGGAGLTDTSTHTVILLSRLWSPKRRAICLERLHELEALVATATAGRPGVTDTGGTALPPDGVTPATSSAKPPATPAELKNLPPFRVRGVYGFLMALSSLLLSAAGAGALAMGWLWLLSTLQILAEAASRQAAGPNGLAKFFLGDFKEFMQPYMPAISVSVGDAMGGAVLVAGSAAVPLGIAFFVIFFVLELMPRTRASFFLILLLWGAFFVWFLGAWEFGIGVLLTAFTLPLLALIGYRVGWELRPAV